MKVQMFTLEKCQIMEFILYINIEHLNDVNTINI